MKSIVAAIAALAVAAVSAQQNIISVTAPLEGTTYQAGSDAIISWINPTVETISQIVLSNGPSTALQPVMTIAENVDAAGGSYTWSVPADLAAGTDYALQFGTSPDVSYAGPFTIAGGSSNSSSSASASAAASSSAPASSSAAASSTPASSSAASSAASSSEAASSSASGDAAEETVDESAAVKSQPAALAALAIAGVAAVAMV
ncbi:Ser-Thr-rich glycosyl-phosphatidyl-inositol-anchored membrane family-domain-containing protein [Zychaea mexicana]|uniref:Ser-Thr-rich glycosyl-phosphatidyl-inositol-anchored membrane family-domain-containing protein n=1 Tax=Zychaea mexicana TaxID=64656 RepID=UPI0022FDECD8|nr:Ser-Thr-rich glycosyl-phosphatidyl-inositol-anchored membrane family-domain-containing protein [Zychaea mexicana]KAI9490762.1 Ser-Thr-rich glycosyl-phosphatidyl-inositol-anchored membrane family-domain-containing protein [Zychaea mexicana]